MYRIREYDDCRFKPYDRVWVRSKSYGRRLEDSIKKHKGLVDKPQLVSDVYRASGRKIVYVVRGDYFLEKDLEHVNPQLSFKF
jgi:hypothetical protein